MPHLSVVNENSECFITLKYTNKAGVAETPSSGNWTLHDGISGASLSTNSTIATLSTSNEITVAHGLNNIRHGKPFELRRFTANLGYGSGQQAHAEFEYLVKNLGQIVSTST